ncbi:MAG TPA: FHA domain-containing protein [Gemmatimonadaceae bacterium]|nr:FHA domain-containing protein [Gemmatimonadaceae bacterium]
MERPVVVNELGAPLTPDANGHPPAPHDGQSGASTPPLIERPVIVEVLGPHGQVRTRTRLAALPAVIGRGYDSDVLIDDPHICPRHAELVRNDGGVLLLRDLGSVNGIGARTGGARPTSIALASGDRVQLGTVSLRVLELDHPVSAATPLAAAGSITSSILHPWRALAICAGAWLALALLSYQASTEGEAVVSAVQQSVYTFVAIAIWAGGWGLATRIVSHRFRVLSHAAWAAGLTIVMAVIVATDEWLDFLFPGAGMASLLTGMGAMLLLPLLVAGHLEIASGMSRSRRWRAAFVVGAVAAIFIVVISLGDDDSRYTQALDYSGRLKPLPAQMVPTVTLNDFMESVAELRDEVDALAEEDAPVTTPSDEPLPPAEPAAPAPDED